MLSRTLQRVRPCILQGLGVRTVAPCRAVTRGLVVLSSSPRVPNTATRSSRLCDCGCGIHGIHTKGDRELVEFLGEEITAEKRNLASCPSYVDDFSVTTSKSEMVLQKKFHDEKITITLDVNHTVNSDAPAELHQDQAAADLSSRPDFEVDIEVGSKVMSFTCSYTPADELHGEGGDQVNEVFGISELTMYDGEWEEKTYCVSGDLLDGMMYDLLMNYLEERGVTDEFVEKLSQACSAYEHSLYVSLLEQLQGFVKRK